MWKLSNGFLGFDGTRRRMGFLLASQCECRNSENSIDHIFFYYIHTNYLWRECALLIDMLYFSLSSFSSIYDCLRCWWNRGKSSSYTFNLFPSFICWILWKNPCSFYFDGKCNINPQLLRLSLVLISDISKAKGQTSYEKTRSGNTISLHGSKLYLFRLSF